MGALQPLLLHHHLLHQLLIPIRKTSTKYVQNTQVILSTKVYQSDGPVVRASASKPEGQGFEPWLSHTKDVKNGTHCLLVWCSTYETGMGKLNTGSYQWTSPLLQLSLHLQICGLGLCKTEIGTTLCTIKFF